MRAPPVFESWHCEAPVLPPRSRLYALEPVGIGTAFVESLAGYVARLAGAHAVSVGDLVGRELSASASAPLLSFGPFMERNRPGSHGFHARSHAVNGFEESAKRWVNALEKATLRTDLRFLTLLPFSGTFCRQAVFRSFRAWCPNCYDDWRSAGSTVYEPLLWAIALAVFCPTHRQPLEEDCSHCAGKMLPLTVYSRPGFCTRCQGWLGSSKRRSRAKCCRGRSEKGTNETTWYSEAVGELLAAAPRLKTPSLRAVFTTNFRACVSAVSEGNQLAFANTCRLSHSVVGRQMIGEKLITINVFFQICYQLRIPPSAFLESDPSRTVAHWERARQAVPRDRMAPLFRTVDQVRRALVEAAQEQPPPSVSEIARRLNYKGAERLYQVDRDLCKRIAANHRTSGFSHSWRKAGAVRICDQANSRELLEQSLAQGRPVSAHHIAANLGYANDGYLQRRFPELCRAIRQKIAAQRVERLASMEEALKNALEEDPVPTLSELCRQLGYSSSETLQYHFPDLCRQIRVRQRVLRDQRIEDLRKTLQAVLLEWRAPSFAGVCKRVGFSRSSLQEMCPEECVAIRSRYLRARREASERRREELDQEVRQIVQRLHREGKCPAVERVTVLLRKTTLREWKALSAAVKAARQELGQPQ